MTMPLLSPRAAGVSRLARHSAAAAAVLTVVSVLALAGCASGPPSPPLPTVAQVDVPGYLGTWYQVALVPNRFQAQCVGDTEARYSLKDGQNSGQATGQPSTLVVENRCRTASGAVDVATGVAEVVPGSGNAKLRVSFFRPFYGDYWVLAQGAGQQWTLVGEPSRQFGWVLSRTPQLPEAELALALDRAEALGYQRSAFVASPQSAR